MFRHVPLAFLILTLLAAGCARKPASPSMQSVTTSREAEGRPTLPENQPTAKVTPKRTSSRLGPAATTTACSVADQHTRPKSRATSRCRRQPPASARAC